MGFTEGKQKAIMERANPLALPARASVTIRQSVSKLKRRTLGTAQYASELSDHLY